MKKKYFLPFIKSIWNKHKILIMLLGIFSISFVLRIFRLNYLPYNPTEDEILSGYVGRFILTNGVDLYGNSWPLLYFDKFGDYYIIGPMYLAGLSTFLFGMTSFAIRFPAALIGSLIVFPVYYFSQFIFANKKISLLVSFCIAITPWHIILSRSSVEGIIGTTVFLAGIVMILRYVSKGFVIDLIIGSLLILITYDIYHPFRIYAPMALVPILFLFSSVRTNWKKIFSISLIALAFFCLTLYIGSTPWGKGRFEQTSIFGELARVEGKIQEQIYNTGEGKIIEARVFHNKVVGYSREFATQYLSYFSPNFLFTKGGAESRYDVPDQGLLYLTFLIFILASLLPIQTTMKVRYDYLLYYLYLLLLAPVPAALTYYGSPNIHRSAFMVVLLVIPVALGVYKIAHIRFGKIIIVALFCILSIEFMYFWHQYSVQSDIYTGLQRNDGQKNLIEYLERTTDPKLPIYIPSEGTMSLYIASFSGNFDRKLASEFRSDVRIDTVGRYNLLETSCTTDKSVLQKSSLLSVNRYDCPDPGSGWKMIKEIKGSNPLLGFKIYQK